MVSRDANKDTLYLIYDGECPLCRCSAHAINIKNAVGNLVLINARESHPLVNSAYARGYNPDHGIIVIYSDQYYFGADAAHFLAMLNSSHGFINSAMASLFRIKLLAKILYPVIKFTRRSLLYFKSVSAIKKNEGVPLFARVLGDDWQKLSPLMKKRFSNLPYSNDIVLASGTMSIKSSRWMHFIKPLLKISGALIQQDGENIPVIVKFKSEINSAKYIFDREFKFKPPIHFQSYMINIKDNIMVDYMRFSVGWRTKLSVGNGRVIMSHDGYVFRLFNFLIPLPMSIFLGKCNVVEYQISEDTFSMEMILNHFLFGKIYEYKGIFKIIE